MNTTFTRFVIALSIILTSQFAYAQTVTSTGVGTCTVLTSPMRLGSKDSGTRGQVSKLQVFLRDAGYLASDPTGHFGPLTYNAVLRFQADNGISPVNGQVGPLTRAMIKGLSCSGTGGSTSTSLNVTDKVLYLAYDGAGGESRLGAKYMVSVTAGSYNVDISKPTSVYSSTLGYFYVKLNNNTGEDPNVYGDTIVALPSTSNIIDNGTYWTIPAGQTGEFNILKTYNPKFLFAGSYTATLGLSTGGNSSNVYNNQTNAVTVIGETSPYIKSITTDTNGNVTVKGSRLFSSGDQRVFITLDGVNTVLTITGRNQDGSSFTFNLSDFGSMATAGGHTLQIINSLVGNSNHYMVDITSASTNTTVVPTVEFIGTPTLKLAYDTAGKESSLVGTGYVKVTAGSMPIGFNNGDHSFVAQLFQFGNSTGNVSTNSLSFSATNNQNLTTIPANTSVIFTVTNKTLTNQLFAGSYRFQPSIASFYYYINGETQSVPASSFINKVSSNAITIIGETSPYISSVAMENGAIVLQGARLNLNGNIVLVDGVKRDMGSTVTSSSIIIPTVVNGITAGGHFIQITNSTTGNSNNAYITTEQSASVGVRLNCGLFRGGTATSNMVASPNPPASVSDNDSACINYCNQSNPILGDMCRRGANTIKTYTTSIPPVSVSVSVSPTSINSGGTYTNLSYSSQNASSCTVYKNGSVAWQGAPTTKSGAPSTWNDYGIYTSDTTWRVVCANAQGQTGEGSVTLLVKSLSSTDQAINTVKSKLAAKLGINSSSVTFVSSEPAQWGSGCMGIPSAGPFCTTEIVQGYIIRVSYNGVTYRYHVNSNNYNAVEYVETAGSPIVSVSVSPSSISSGQQYSTFGWTSQNASSCTVFKNGVQVSTNEPPSKLGPPAIWGDYNNYTVNTTWRVVCTNAQGQTGEGSVTLTVVSSLAPSLTFTVDKTNLTLGDSIRLDWSALNVDSCSANQGWSGTPFALFGSSVKTPSVVGPQTFGITCSGDGGSITKTVTFTVLAPTSTVMPSAILTVPNCTIASGASTCTTSVSWTSSNLVTALSVLQNGTQISTQSSKSAMTRYLTYGSGAANTFTIVHNGSVISTKTGTASCATGTTWNGAVCQAPVVQNSNITGTISSSLSPCVIAEGKSSCTVFINWSVANPYYVAGVTNLTLVNASGVSTPLATATNSAYPVITRGTHQVKLSYNGVLLDSETISADCVTGTTWNGSTCVAPVAVVGTPTVSVTSATYNSITISYANLPKNSEAVLIDIPNASSRVQYVSKVLTDYYTAQPAGVATYTFSNLNLKTSTYKIRIIPAGTITGMIADSAQFSITAPAPTVSTTPTLTLTVPSGVLSNTSAQIKWDATNVASCTANAPGYTLAVSPSWLNANFATPKLTTPFTITVTCEGLNGTTITKSATIQITTINAPSVSVYMTPTSPTVGSRAILSWNSNAINYCDIYNDTTGNIEYLNQPTNGSKAVYLTEATTYRVVCGTSASAGGVSTVVKGEKSLTVQVTGLTVAPPSGPSTTFGSTKTQITSGESATLSWTSSTGSSCMLTNLSAGASYGAWESVSITGSKVIAPTKTITYQLRCSYPLVQWPTSGSFYEPYTAKTVTVEVVPASGVLGVSTMCVDLPFNFHRGNESVSTKKLQSFLIERGYLDGEVTGFYGDKTVSAVRDYQLSKGLPVTGMVYDFTRASIKADSCQ